MLRFDDTDRERSREEFVQAIEVDLEWLGVRPDVTVRQSAREALYAAAAERLKACGRLYPCYETAEELDRRRKLPTSARAAADLRPRRLAAHRPPTGRRSKRGPEAALALSS